MVGFRVVDLGALVAWLVWFYRQCDKEDDESDGEDFRGPGEESPPQPPRPTGGRGLEPPLPDASPWPNRRRGHDDQAWASERPERRVTHPRREPDPALTPAEA